MKYFSTILAIVVLVVSCQEDTFIPDIQGTIRGTVTTGETLDPVEGALISTTPPTDLIRTDSNGRFEIDSLVAGSYTVRISKDGFDNELLAVQVNSEREIEVEILLDPIVSDDRLATAENPFPADKSEDLPIDIRLAWQIGEGVITDSTRFDVLLYSDELLEGVEEYEGISDTAFNINGLRYGKTYYWQIRTRQEDLESELSEVWQFKTGDFPNDLFRIHYVREVDGYQQIFAATEAGAEIQLTNSQQSKWRPILSPNRQKVAYISFVGQDAHLFTMDRNGTNQKQITTSVPIDGYDLEELRYSWSPNGASLLYMNFNRLYQINVDGSGLQRIFETMPARAFAEVDWHPSGRILSRIRSIKPFQSSITLYYEDNDGEYAERVLIEEDSLSVRSPSFSVDGEGLLLVRDFENFLSEEGRMLDARIIFYPSLIDPGTSEFIDYSSIEDISSKEIGTNDIEPLFSPTGGKIIFMNQENDMVETPDLYILDLDTDQRTLFIPNATMPDWQ